MRAWHVAGWALVLCGWSLTAAAPLLSPVQSGTVAVIFAPWTKASDQIDAVTAADLFVLERHGPSVMVAMATGQAVDRSLLRRHGALLVVDRQAFALCSNDRPLSNSPLALSEI